MMFYMTNGTIKLDISRILKRQEDIFGKQADFLREWIKRYGSAPSQGHMSKVIDASGTVTVNLGKGGKDRITYIGVKTLKLLTRYHFQRGKPAGKEAIFVSQTSGDRLTVYGLAQVMERLRDATKVEICTCHTFRRTFAISCLRNGMNIYVLARLMGHVDIVILKQYLDIIADDLKTAHQKYGVVDNMQTPHSSRVNTKRP